MIYKIGLSVSGDNFFPESVVNEMVGNFILKSSNRPNDKFENRDGTYNFGNALFWYVKNFATQNYVARYEKYFVDFLEENHSLFIKKGAEDFSFFLEIYFDGGQCNFEILSKDLLSRIANLKVSISISVYVLSEEYIQNWSNEIDVDWSTD
ncbi:hypothetical protein M0L20_28660 [Spirosoma sp. RP8]|uniref:DUF4279 domain-containing protein n=1 Tax=Spirosoma liriopis TaxID=2937440 RepID=A0ABT0HUJ9_9BACT|nr:hypothetical protein [Spirosoma liriopis]MCK8495872.1 hypothetical protein [Spirosoma liriopis]